MSCISLLEQKSSAKRGRKELTTAGKLHALLCCFLFYFYRRKIFEARLSISKHSHSLSLAYLPHEDVVRQSAPVEPQCLLRRAVGEDASR